MKSRGTSASEDRGIGGLRQESTGFIDHAGTQYGKRPDNVHALSPVRELVGAPRLERHLLEHGVRGVVRMVRPYSGGTVALGSDGRRRRDKNSPTKRSCRPRNQRGSPGLPQLNSPGPPGHRRGKSSGRPGIIFEAPVDDLSLNRETGGKCQNNDSRD